MKRLNIFSYSANFPEIFEEQRKKIALAIGDYEIHHIGSTAIPGLGGKGIIDIMVAIDTWKQTKEITEKLKSIGFGHIHPEEEGRIFASNKKESGFADFHLHIVKKGSKTYEELLCFRDYLRKHPKEVVELFKLKLLWQKQSKSDRKLYGKLKADYVNKILNK